MSGYSKACCTLPPAVAEDYTTKGSYETIGGLKTYVTGDKTASKAIFLLYDIFGYSPPTLQGADIISAAGYLLVIPDLLNSRLAQAQWFSSTAEEDVKTKNEFMAYIGDMPQHLQRFKTSLAALKSEYKSVEKWGSIGYCWGGKVAAVTSGTGTAWTVSVQSSPAMIDPKDAEKITIPHMMLASGDEPKDQVEAFEKALKTTKAFETFSDQPHGWMGARGDFKNVRSKEEYERGYRLAVGFFQEHL